jgi:hypothetical protein
VATAREIAVLVACERVIRHWPVAARIAFREAVMADVTTFSSGDWDPAAALIAAEIFGDRWRRGLPWPPSPTELAPRPAAPLDFDRDAVAALARRIRALGLPLALASR